MKTFNLKNYLNIAILLGCLAVTADARPTKKIKLHHLKNDKTKGVALSEIKIKNVQFGFNQTAIPEEYQKNLDGIVKLMADNKAALKLGGYTDSKGPYVYNWKLSKKRADAVKDYLVSKGGDESRIASTEFGETKPIAPNKQNQVAKKTEELNCNLLTKT